MIPPEIFESAFELQINEHRNWCESYNDDYKKRILCHATQIFNENIANYGDTLHFHYHICQKLTCHVYVLLERTLTSITGKEITLS